MADPVYRDHVPYIKSRRNGGGSLRWYWCRPGFKASRLPDDEVARIAEARRLNADAHQTATPSRPKRDPLAKIDKRLAERIFERSKRQAASRRLPFALTPEDVARMLVRSGGECELTGISFNADARHGRATPYAASIDRMDSTRGYEPGNCRLVCFCVNVALSNLGDAAFRRMCLTFAHKEGWRPSRTALLDVLEGNAITSFREGHVGAIKRGERIPTPVRPTTGGANGR